MRRTRRTTRLALHCEPLETRQLLSVGQAGLAAGAILNSATAAAQISVPAQVFNSAPASFSVIGIQYGTLSGVSQLQIIVFASGGAFSQSFGGGPVFSPSPTPTFGGSGSGLGTLSGTSGTGNSATGLTFPTSLNSSSSITPLNPSATSITNTAGGPPVILVPPPLVSLAIHLGSSTAPATAQTNSTLISNLDEQPASFTHFGQQDVVDAPRLFAEKLDARPRSTSLIDYLEPFRSVAPIEAPQAQPAPRPEQAPAPDAAKILLPPLSDPEVDAALDLTDVRVLTRSRDGDDSQPDDRFSNTNTSWSFSAAFGVAAVATGGYHLAMREADRFRGRWIPRWAGAERPTKRKMGLPSH